MVANELLNHFLKPALLYEARRQRVRALKESILGAISLSNEPLEKRIIREGTMVPGYTEADYQGNLYLYRFLRIRFIDIRPPLLRYNRQLTMTSKEMK
jgi:hypothetical protein